MYQPDALINNDSGISLDLKTENEKRKTKGICFVYMYFQQ